ncbi:flavin reductase family protein [Massilia sp. YIM B02763]|uniref:flavin reductase family protein n=1 Tax=Massilia sp. YIM B02763 TaxID=3050130 RepID=UPI0025B7156B|nr:flavin reductase family protein [Massilia sp. YIM B02763]MDN4056017.1 flavin reductase family protein [Massilia sp. YIM B02763]
MIIDPQQLGAPALYKILIGTVLPRPIGWVSTVSAAGVPNLAPFSFFTVVARKPPMVSLTIQPRADLATPKDTLANMRETGEFAVHIVSLAQVNEMHLSAVDHPADVDEFAVTGLERQPCDLIRPPRVAGAPVAMECRVKRIVGLGEVGDHVVIGEVLRFHVRDDLWHPNGRVDTAAIQPVGRLAAEYTVVDTTFACPAPAELVAGRAGSRMRRLDGRDAGWAAVDDKHWSASGNARID